MLLKSAEVSTTNDIHTRLQQLVHVWNDRIGVYDEEKNNETTSVLRYD